MPILCCVALHSVILRWGSQSGVPKGSPSLIHYIADPQRLIGRNPFEVFPTANAAKVNFKSSA